MESFEVSLIGSLGTLRWTPQREDDEGVSLAGDLFWEGALDGPGVALLLRTVLQQGSIACEVEGVPHRLKPRGIWYDAGTGLVVCEVSAPPQPLV